MAHCTQLAGWTLIGLGVWIHIFHDSLPYNALFRDNTTGPILILDRLPITLVVIGSAVSIIGFLGCCGACTESVCFLGFVRIHCSLRYARVQLFSFRIFAKWRLTKLRCAIAMVWCDVVWWIVIFVNVELSACARVEVHYWTNETFSAKIPHGKLHKTAWTVFTVVLFLEISTEELFVESDGRGMNAISSLPVRFDPR